MDKYLEGFHHRAERRMAGMGPKRQLEGTWVYPPNGAAHNKVSLEDIGLYISRHQNMVTQYITTCRIMDLYFAEEQKPGMRISGRWWEQPALDTISIKAGKESAEGGGIRGVIGVGGGRIVGKERMMGND